MLEGLSLERHFVLLYELLSLGNARLSLLPTDCPRVMAALLLRALPVADWREGGPLVGLLALLAAQPLLSLEEAAERPSAPGAALAEALPRYDALKQP